MTIDTIKSEMETRKREQAEFQRQADAIGRTIDKLYEQLNEAYAESLLAVGTTDSMFVYCDNRGFRGEPKDYAATKEHILGNIGVAVHIGYSIELEDGLIAVKRNGDVTRRFWVECDT